MLRVPARLQALPYTSRHQAWIRNVPVVDGSSDVLTIGGPISSVSHSSLLVPQPPAFLCEPSGAQTGGTAYLRFLSPLCPFASVPRWRTKGADLMPLARVLPRVVVG